MTSLVLTERRHSGGFIVMEGGRDAGSISRDQVLLLQQSSNFQSSSSPVLPAGVVLGEQDAASATYEAHPGNTGNFTCGAVTVSEGAQVGGYQVEFTGATAFNVYYPNGTLIGAGATGSAFTGGGISFTLTAGGTAAVTGDGATITTSLGSGGFVPLNLAAHDGSEIATCILFNETDASGGNVKATVISRNCEVNGSELVYPASATAAEIAAVNNQLAGKGIIVR